MYLGTLIKYSPSLQKEVNIQSRKLKVVLCGTELLFCWFSVKRRRFINTWYRNKPGATLHFYGIMPISLI